MEVRLYSLHSLSLMEMVHYSLLLGRDWIHANCCVPSTVHQCLIQWHEDDVELVHANDSVSIAIADPMY